MTLLSLLLLVAARPFASMADITTDGKTVVSKAYVDATLQPKIDATNNAYTYNESTNPTAAGSVITTTTTPGTTGQVGIATAPTYNGNTLTNGDWIPTMGAVMTAISNATPPAPSGTPNNVAMYDSNGDLGDGQPTANAATYNNDTLTNGNSIATITAVETKVSKTQSTGYQVLTTGTSGTVTPAYLSVPVTASGTGRPAANNAPTGTAAIWIE